MNMKTLAVLIMMGLSYAALAQQYQGEQQGNRGRDRQLDPTAQECLTVLAGQTTTTESTTTNGQTVTSETTRGLVATPDQIERCNTLEQLSKSANSSLRAAPDAASTAKGELQCRRDAGFTLDFIPCISAIKALNTVINTEAALLLAQSVSTQVKEKNIQEQAVKQVAAGDGVAGVFDASIAQNQHLKSMEQQKALAYAGAVAALGATYVKWPNEEKLLASHCEKIAQAASVTPAKCQEYAQGLVIANKDAKAALALKITEYIAKGVAAGIKMGQFNTRAEAVEKAKDSLNPEDEDAMFERCQFNPTDPMCATPGNRVSGPGYSGGGDFALGGGGNNSFDMGTGNDEFGEDGEAATIGDEVVAATNNPFLDDAKAANDILDPAAAASMQAGAAPGGGGGVGGGGGGGGGASLGSDLEGVDKDPAGDPNLKTSKSSGNYAFGAGGGFQAIKGGKEDKNPFASLFDSKSAGGIEEDRSIASADDGPGSGLFQRISKRYKDVHAKKKIEANNLE